MGKNKQVSCKICFKSMRSDHLNLHMKVHITYTSPEVQSENSEEICKDIVNDIVDKMFMQENSTLEITHEEQHDQPTLKRKLTNDDEEYQSNIKKKYKIDVGDLKKAMEKENDEYNYKLAFGEAIEKVLREGKVNQASLSKDKKEALEAYRKEDDQFDVYKDAVLYPWQQELMKHMIPTDRQVIWVVGEKTDEGNFFFSKIYKSNVWK